MISPRFSSNLFGSLFSFVLAASSVADTIGEANISDESHGNYLASRNYPILADRSPGNALEVDPRFRFRALCVRTDEGAAWNLYIELTQEGWEASPPVTAKEYLALVNQGLERFMKDLPEAKVRIVSLDLTNDSEILPDIVKALRPIFEGGKKDSMTDPPNALTKGLAIEFPKESIGVFYRAAQASAASQRVAAEMARRLGRKYVKVIGSNDEFTFGEKGKFWGRPWDELLKDHYLGIAPDRLQLTFVFGPQSAARQ